MVTCLLCQAQLREFAQSVLRGSWNSYYACLLSERNIACCDEAVGVEVGGQVVSIAAIGPHGDQFSSEPTIVVVFTKPQFQSRGFGRRVLVDAIARCRQRGFEKVRIDVASTYIMHIIATLPEADRAYLHVVDQLWDE